MRAVQHHASQSLTSFGGKPTDLGQIILRVTLARNTNSATSVFKALLAFSSLHRYGAHSQAFELKLSSLRALATASNPETEIGAIEVVQHIVAGMLLCSFEVSRPQSTIPTYIITNSQRHTTGSPVFLHFKPMDLVYFRCKTPTKLYVPARPVQRQ